MSTWMRTMFVSYVIVSAASCKDSRPADPAPATAQAPGAAVPASAPPAAKAAGCAFLSAATVKEVTGVTVTATEHGNPQSCALFKTESGKDYLLVATTGPSGYRMFLESNSPSMFPVRTSLPGIGTEAVLLRWDADPSSSRTLIVHNDVRTVVLTPMPAPSIAPITDAQLTELARRSVAN